MDWEIKDGRGNPEKTEEEKDMFQLSRALGTKAQMCREGQASKAHYIKVYSDSDSDEELIHEQGHQVADEETSQTRSKGPTIASRSGFLVL